MCASLCAYIRSWGWRLPERWWMVFNTPGGVVTVHYQPPYGGLPPPLQPLWLKPDSLAQTRNRQCECVCVRGGSPNGFHASRFRCCPPLRVLKYPPVEEIKDCLPNRPPECLGAFSGVQIQGKPPEYGSKNVQKGCNVWRRRWDGKNLGITLEQLKYLADRNLY